MPGSYSGVEQVALRAERRNLGRGLGFFTRISYFGKNFRKTAVGQEENSGMVHNIRGTIFFLGGEARVSQNNRNALSCCFGFVREYSRASPGVLGLESVQHRGREV